jgi:hypothetical protein
LGNKQENGQKTNDWKLTVKVCIVVVVVVEGLILTVDLTELMVWNYIWNSFIGSGQPSLFLQDAR